MTTLVEAFAAEVDRHGPKLALQDGDRTWTFAELDRAANRLAHAILERRPRPGEPVGILLPQSAESVIAIIAVWKAGHVQLSLDSAAPPSRTTEVLGLAEARLVVTDEAHRSAVEGAAVDVLRVDAPTDGGRDDRPDADVHDDSIACIYFTSGTTGRPKGVIGRHGDQVARREPMRAVLRPTPDDRMALTYDLSFGASRGSLVGGLLSGASVHVFDLRSRGATALAPWLVDQAITVASMTPSLLRRVLEDLPDGDNFPSMRMLRVGAERLYGRDVVLFRSKVGRHCGLANNYAAAEMSTVTSYLVDVDDPPEGVVPVGTALPGVDIRILDPDHRGIGEIVVHTDHLAAGYWGQPDRTAAAFRGDEDPAHREYRTGDLGRLRPDGLLELHGRRDGRIKLRGFSVDLAEVERVLVETTPARDAVVVVDQRDGHQARLVAYVVLVPGASASPAALRRTIATVLPDYMVPAVVLVLDELPVTTRGKVDRAALPAPPSGRPDLDVPFVAPRDDLERTIAGVWEAVLGLGPVGVDDDFLELGGDSLNAAEIISLLGDALGRELPFSIALEARTVARFAELLRDVSRPFSAVVPLRTEGGRPPIFCVHGGEGDVFDLRWLARLLGDDQPFYGLQMIDSAEVRRAARSIPDLAAYYLDTVRAVRPDGPIVLCGYSSGGFVAYEMARQTAARGEPPPVLVLLDTPARHDGTRRREFERSRLAALPPTARLRRRVKVRLFRARLAGYARMGTHVPGRRRRVFRLYLSGRAVAGYRIEPYDGPVLLTRARDREAPAAPDLGWGGHAVGPFRVVDVPGGHHSFLRWPNVETLALALRGALDDMAAHAPSSGGTQS